MERTALRLVADLCKRVTMFFCLVLFASRFPFERHRDDAETGQPVAAGLARRAGKEVPRLRQFRSVSNAPPTCCFSFLFFSFLFFSFFFCTAVTASQI